MPFEEIRRNIPRHNFFICLQRLQITISQLRRHLETDMQQLPEALVIRLVSLFVT